MDAMDALRKHWILGTDGEPQAVDEATWLANAAKQGRIATTLADDQVGATQVSTVFLGIALQHLDPPIVFFETMLFSPAESSKVYDRYATRADALAGHGRAVEELRRSQS